MNKPTYTHYLAEEGAAMFRVGEYTLNSFPDSLRPLAEFLKEHPNVIDLAYTFENRPHINHILKRKDENGVSNAL